MNSNEKNEATLDKFRRGWEEELKNNSPNSSTSSEMEKRASEFFMQGISLERQGKVFEALSFYRKAVNLVPDIEFRSYEANQKQQDSIKIKKNYIDNVKYNNNDDKDISNMIECFQNSLALSTNQICESSYTAGTISTVGIHISSLPFEIMLFILKWVVSNQLDFRSLESFSCVCKGFYLISRDASIWKTACKKVWGTVLLNEEYPSWRKMFMNKPRVNFNGCYISKVTYQRYGENSFQDQYYRPVQIVEYFRIIRFLPNGKLLMFTSTDDIQKSINKIKNLNCAYELPEILLGNYKYEDSYLIITIRKPQLKRKQKRSLVLPSEYGVLTFYINLQIESTRKSNFTKLSWIKYSSSQQSDQEVLTSEFDLSSASKFSPFYFSRVKSFHQDSTEFLSV
ncbi:unnamed protein product [Diamesa tonsa]